MFGEAFFGGEEGWQSILALILGIVGRIFSFGIELQKSSSIEVDGRFCTLF